MQKYLLFIFSFFLLASCSSEIASPTVTEAVSHKTILALGDSLTAGYGLVESESYPSQLEQKLQELGYSSRVQNAGISWDTTAGLLSRLDWVLDGVSPPGKGGQGGFALAILCIGANDTFQWKNPEDIEKNIRAIIEKLQSKKIPILLAGMKAPLNLGWAYGKQYEAIFPKLAKEYDLSYMDFLLEWVALKWELNQDDRIHPNKAGYAIVVENLVEILESEGMVGK
jgi:acyl-CoA thioesterase I